MRSFAGDDCVCNIKLRAGNKKQARADIRQHYAGIGQKVTFSQDRVYVSNGLKRFYQWSKY